jgi:hypothetical protein
VTVTPVTSLAVGLIVFVCLFGGALGGMLLREALPEHHRGDDTLDVIKLSVGIVATTSALVVGLLIASAKSSFDTKDGELNKLSSDIIVLDRQLAHYGPETREIRDLLRRYTFYKLDSTWPAEATHPPEGPDGWRLLEDLQDRLRALTPQNDAQRWLQARALQVSADIAGTRWLLSVQIGIPIPKAFLVVLVFWLTIIFVSFGLFAPRNATAVIALLVCSASIAGSIFLIVEMAQPFGGLIRVSSAPMRQALAELGQPR